MKGLDLKQFKKVASDEHTTTLQHPHGHQIIVAHKALTPKMRKDITALKMAEGGLAGSSSDSDKYYAAQNEKSAGQKISEGVDAAKKEVGSWFGGDKKEAAPEPKEHMRLHNANGSNYHVPGEIGYGSAKKYADGGPVDNGPKLDPKKTKANDDDVNSGWSLDRLAGNIKEAMTPYQEPQPKQKPQPRLGFADGGEAPAAPQQAASAPPAQVDPVQQVDQATAQAAPEQQADPALAKKRQIYNQVVNANAGTGGPVSFPDKSFGADGTPPANFDPRAWSAAEQMYSQQNNAEQAGAASQNAKLIEDNKARVAAGLAPLPVPEMPQDQPNANAVPAQGLAAQQQPTSQAGVPQAPNDPMGIQAQSDAYMKGIGEQKAGLFGEAQALGQQGKQEAATLAQATQNQQQAMKTYQDHFNDLDTERKHFQEDLMNKHIDPNRFMNSMGTGQKISTAIGLILGGLGGAHNNALDYLKFQINNDIESQKAEMGKTENLLKFNMEQFKNQRDAVDMTRAMQNDIVSNQLKMAAAKTMDPLAKSRALQAAGKLDMESSQMIGQMAMRKSLLSGAQAGKTSPELVLRAYGAPEAAFKELATAQDQVKNKDMMLAGFDQLAKINTMANRASSPLQTKRQVDAIKGHMVAALSKATAGRFTEQDAGMLDPIFKQVGDNPETVAKARHELNLMLSQTMNYPMLKQYNIDPTQQSGRYDTQGQSKIKFTPGVK